MPAFSALRSDVDGNLWVREFDTEMPGDRHERWNIFDPNGLYLGVLEMPKAFSVLNVGDDYVAGVWKDAFGTERARVYDLKKPARR
jgi:sugar lactone lactonase YvrE